jgi:tRNA-Thr(GGU) m(6)t(6)A37 methyltransferase TsaA
MDKSEYQITPIGHIRIRDGSTLLEIRQEYSAALEGFEGFSHVIVLWWCHQSDSGDCRKTLFCKKPYTKGPDRIGVFATRSPVRPNPIALTPVPILKIDHERSTIHIPYIDAEDRSPIVDLKPYHPSIDRIRDVRTPDWCSHWPAWYEDSALFNWEEEFNMG